MYRLKPPPLGMNVVRIDTAPDKSGLRYLSGSQAIGIDVTKFASHDKPAGMSRTALAIDPSRTWSGLHDATISSR